MEDGDPRDDDNDGCGGGRTEVSRHTTGSGPPRAHVNIWGRGVDEMWEGGEGEGEAKPEKSEHSKPSQVFEKDKTQEGRRERR